MKIKNLETRRHQTREEKKWISAVQGLLNGALFFSADARRAT
jgi:hypothetical protein